MSATYSLLTRWRIAKNLKNDSQAALALGVSRQTIQNWKEGRNGEASYLIKMANDLGENPTKTVLEAYAEKEKGESAKGLLKLSKQFGAIVMAFLVGAGAIAPRTAQARTGADFAEYAGSVYYVNIKGVWRILEHFGAFTRWTIRTLQHHPAYKLA